MDPVSGDLGRLRARRVLVTGASRGIGAAFSQRAAAEGADVAVWTGNVARQPMMRGVPLRLPEDGLPNADAVMERVRRRGLRGVAIVRAPMPDEPQLVGLG